MNFKKSKHVQNSIRIITAKRTISLAIAIALFFSFSLNAQTVPDPPKPPKTTTSSGTSYSISIDNDDNIKSNSSVSISVSDDTYKFRASYHKSKTEGVKKILLNQLGKGNLNVKGNTYLWTDNKNGDEVFECKLTNGHLRMYVDIDSASDAFVKKINNLGNDLKYYISGTNRKKEEAKSAERAKRDLERAERDLERAKKELERAKLEAKRTKKN